jgi:DHA2 family multidrug resistance protein-like MFS transporter
MTTNQNPASPTPRQGQDPDPSPTAAHPDRDTSPAQPPAARAGRREWTGLAVLLLALLIASMDVSVLYFAVPFIGRELRPSATQQLWIYDMYGFVLAGLLITMGSIGDRIGRRRLLLAGAVAFSLASLAAAYSHSAGELIAARAVLGIGGATLMPSSLALIRNMFHDEKQRRTAIGIWTAGTTSGVALGPVISGVLLEHFWWGSVFLINIPIMALLLCSAPFLLPEYKPASPGRFDLLGALLSLGAVLPAVYGMNEIAENGASGERFGCVGFGVAMGVLFVLRQRRAAAPMIDLKLFRSRGFSGSIVLNMFAMFALVGFAIFVTQYLQSALGMSPLRAAIWSILPAAGAGGVAPLTTVLMAKLDRAYVAGGGFLLAAGGYLVLSRIDPHTHLWLVLVGALMYAAGLVSAITVASVLMLGDVPPERAGSVSAVIETVTELGGALGMAVLGSIGAALYRHELSATLPAGLPRALQSEATSTLGGALVAAKDLPGQAGAQLVSAARAAFDQSLDRAALFAAAALVIAAVISFLSFRGVPVEEPERPAKGDGAAGPDPSDRSAGEPEARVPVQAGSAEG